MAGERARAVTDMTPEQSRQFRMGLLFGIVLGLLLTIIVLHTFT